MRAANHPHTSLLAAGEAGIRDQTAALLTTEPQATARSCCLSVANLDHGPLDSRKVASELPLFLLRHLVLAPRALGQFSHNSLEFVQPPPGCAQLLEEPPPQP